MFCTNCGNTIKEGTRFCTKCGAPAKAVESAPVVEKERKVEPAPVPKHVSAAPQSIPVPQPVPAAKKDSNTGLVVAVVVILVVLFLFIGGYFILQAALSSGNDDYNSNNRDEYEYDYDYNYDDSYVESDDAEVDFYTVDASYITTYVLPAFASTYDLDGAGGGFALVYYNTDLVPEMYIFANGILYEFNADGTVVATDVSRAELLVRGIEVATLIKSETIEDAYEVLTDPNYNAMIGGESDYILPTSNVEYLTREDIEHLTPEQCRFARNEIYARNGRRFLTDDLQYYFDAKDWYEGTIEAADFNDATMLNEYEKANATLILEYEKEMGYID